jgi:hypothetical protein
VGETPNYPHRSDHIQPIGTLSVYVYRPSGGLDRSEKLSNLGVRAGPSGRMRRDNSRKEERSNVMPLIQLLEVLIVVGVLLWLINRFIPMQGTIKSILNGVVVIAVVLWLLNVFGLFHSLTRIHIGT